jgi:hypothetical protein
MVPIRLFFSHPCKEQLVATKSLLLVVLILFALISVGCSKKDSQGPDDDNTLQAEISDLAVQSTTAFSATLTWTSPGSDGSSSPATQYDIRFSTMEITEEDFIDAPQATGILLLEPSALGLPKPSLSMGLKRAPHTPSLSRLQMMSLTGRNQFTLLWPVLRPS